MLSYSLLKGNANIHCLCNNYCATVTDGDLQDCAARAREVR